MYQSTHPASTPEEIKNILGEDFYSQTGKIIDHIDVHCKKWIKKSPFIVISSADASGRMDVSPKGDPPGFVRVLDQHTLVIPDRMGNHRGDTFLNVLQNANVGIVFIIPKRREVVRVSGEAQVIRDPQLLEGMEINNKVPDLALLVRVREAFFHCGKSMIRSNMWQPEKWGSIEGLPTYAQALKDHGDRPEPLSLLEDQMAGNEKHRLY